MTEWKKIPSKLQSARKKAPYYLEVREGVYRTSYRVRFRGEGIELEEVLDGDFKDWTEALKEADRLIAKARFGEKETPKDLIRTESVISQLLSETDGQDRATIDIKNNIFLKHITPWVNESMAYASTITVASWPAYKKFKRQERATIALENHYKYFAMLARRIWELGIIKNKVRISFDVKKEDFRKKGLVIPDDHFALMVQAATPKNFMKVPRIQPKWRDRIILQRRTGLRPGEARDLEKSRVILRTDFAIIDIPAEDSKTDIPRKFKVRHPDVLEILERRIRLVESPYFFPSEMDPSRPMDKGLKGWYGLLDRAFKGLPVPEYTPHDLRHTYATEMFKKTNKYAQLCYQLNMSLEVAQETYIHLNEDDTDELADLAQKGTDL